MITLGTADQWDKERQKYQQEQPKQPDPGRDQIKLLNAYYRAAHDFMMRHMPPLADDENYWLSAADDLQSTSSMYGNAAFLMDLLAAVYNELRRMAGIGKTSDTEMTA